MIKIAIVEDDPSYAETLNNYLKKYSSDIQVVFEVSIFQNAIQFLDQYKSNYDVVFMDIQMPYLDGMTAAHKLREFDPFVLLVFVTNLSNYAIKGYEVNAIDYILKPIEYEEFAMKFARIFARLEKKEKTSLSVNTEKGTIKFAIHELLFIEVMNHELIIHTTKGNYKQYASLSSVEEKLKGTSMVRCNSFLLVNLFYATACNNNEVTITYNDINHYLPISRSKKKTFLAQLKTYLEA